MNRALDFINRAISFPPLVSGLRVALGIVFIVASLDKIQNPEAFAENIANYRIVPHAFIHIMVVVLPWLEIVVGSLLVLGIWTRANAALAFGMLFAFILVITQALIRDLDISCGCFDTTPSAHRMTRWTLYWDLIWIVWAALVFFYDRNLHSITALMGGNNLRSLNHENP